MREQALHSSADTLGLRPTSARPRVFGVVMDVRWSLTVTVVALGDGTASVYLSSGGGVLGAGSRPTVSAAREQVLNTAELRLEDMQPVEEVDSFTGTSAYGLPARGFVKWHLL